MPTCDPSVLLTMARHAHGIYRSHDAAGSRAWTARVMRSLAMKEWDLDRDCDLLRAHITEQMAGVLAPGTWRLVETIRASHSRLPPLSEASPPLSHVLGL